MVPLLYASVFMSEMGKKHILLFNKVREGSQNVQCRMFQFIFPLSSYDHIFSGRSSKSEMKLLLIALIDFYLFQIVLRIGVYSRWWFGESGDGAVCYIATLLRSHFFCYADPSKLSHLYRAH